MKTYINGNCIEQIITNAVTLTQQEYDALPTTEKNHGTYIISDADSPSISATSIQYKTGVSVKDALDTDTDPSDIVYTPVSGSEITLQNTSTITRQNNLVVMNLILFVPQATATDLEIKIGTFSGLDNLPQYTTAVLLNKSNTQLVGSVILAFSNDLFIRLSSALTRNELLATTLVILT